MLVIIMPAHRLVPHSLWYRPLTPPPPQVPETEYTPASDKEEVRGEAYIFRGTSDRKPSPTKVPERKWSQLAC